MVNPETASHQALDGYPSLWGASLQTGLAAYPVLEASHLPSSGRPQPTVGRVSDASRDAAQPTPPSLSLTPGHALPAQDIRQLYPNVYSGPQHWHAYYDATWHRPFSSHPHPVPLFASMSGPHLPSISPPSTALVTDAMSESPLASLRALRSQFAAFQESLGEVKADVKDALSQLHALRTAQNKTHNRIAELEGVIGVSSTGTASRGRGRPGRERGRSGRHAEPTLEGADAIVPEKTLVQSLASIQYAVEELLVRECGTSQSHPSLIRQEVTSPPLFPPSVNPTGQESSRTSSPPRPIVNPSQQYLTLQFTQSASTILSASQSESSSSPPSSIAIPTPEFGTSSPSAAPGKDSEYADMSIQACPPSPAFEPSCSLSHSQRRAPGFTPVDWNVDPATLGRSTGSSARPTAYTAEYFAHFPHDNHLPSATNIVMDSQLPQSDGDCPLRSLTASYAEVPTRSMSAPSLSSYQNESGADNSASQRVQSTVLPAASSSPDTSVVSSVGGTTPAAETPSSLKRVFHQGSLLQTPSSTIEGIDSSMRSPGFRPPGSSQTPLTSQPRSLSGTYDTLISVSGTPGSREYEDCLVQPRAESDPEDVHMTSSTDGDEISVICGVKMDLRPILAAPVHRRQSSPVEANDGGLTSGLPTPPSETYADDHGPQAVSRSTREHGAATDPTIISRTYLRQTFPVIPTPPSLTPEPSGGEDRGALDGGGGGKARQGSLGASSESLSPLTPPLLSPSPAVESLLSEKGGSDVSGQAAAQKVTEELTDSMDDARGTVVRGGDVAEGVRADEASMIDNERSSSGPQTDPGVDESISATNSAVSNEDSSREPQGSSVGQPDIELPEHHPDANGIAPMGGYEFGCSSPWRRPLASTPATPWQNVTPSDPSGSPPTEEENEVSSVLKLGASGMSTPVPDSASLPMIFSPHRASRASSVPTRALEQPSTSTSTYTNDSGVAHGSATLPPELFAVDPSVLHAPTSTFLPHGPESTSVPPVSDTSLSPLTSLDDTDSGYSQRTPHDRDRDRDDDTPRRRKKSRAIAPADRPRGSSSRGRQSNTYHATPSSRAAASSDVRAASESTAVGNLNGRVVGGPSVSLDELTLLARRRSLKIYLRLPDPMRGMKRKWDVVDGGGEGEGEGKGEGEGEEARRESGVDDNASRERQGEEVVSTEVSANVPPCPIRMVGSTPGTLMPIVPRPALESSTSSGLVGNTGGRPDVTSCLTMSGKRMRKQSERGKEASEHAHVRPKKRKRASKAKPNSLVKYHVRNGQIVALEPEPEPTPELQSHARVPVTPSVSEPSVRSEEAAQESRMATQMCHRRGQENQAMKAPLSSPAISRHPSPRSSPCVKSSPTKEDMWNTMLSQGGGTWPKLPSMFSHWDAQFIQCDNCDMWFHYGCVAIMPGDLRLEPDALFICPTCHTQSARRQTLRNHDDTCARPDCPEPQVTGETELYFVEKLVGRKKTEGYVYMWLAKWEGFPMTQASWIPKENVVGDGTKLFNAFLEDAVKEGADVSQDVVLLQEALEAGWKAC